ncbi:hypothetical protein B566_EDAN016898, partial [Ephemera danica]
LTVSTGFWISGHNIGTSSWIWINGEFIIFSDWDIGQPDYPAMEHCIYIQNGKWDDGYCEWRGEWGEQGFVCEERDLFKESVREQRSIYPTDLLNLVTLDPATGKQYLFANVSPSGPPTEQCIHIFNGNWYDIRCLWKDDSAAFICESRE